MTDLKSLIAELERAKEGGRELGVAVSLAAGWKHIDGPFGPVLHLEKCSGREKDCYCVWRNPTLSLEAAQTLVPEGWCGGGRLLVGLPPYGMVLLATDGLKVRLPGPKLVSSSGATPALALCSVALKALEDG